jgi:predicted transposase YdaD
LKPEEQSSKRSAQRKRTKKVKAKQDSQPFDNIIKAAFGVDAAMMVPEFIEGTDVVSAENIELDRSKLKADLVFRTYRKRRETIIDFELQAGPDPDMVYRILQYIAALYDRYREAVIICVIIYLFRCKVVTSPHVMGYDDGEDYFTIKFRVICLWELDPEPIVARHLMPFYILLPGMKDPSLDLLRQALKEMAQHYSRPILGYRLIWFSYILRRTDTMSAQDKQTIEEELGMLYNYDEIVRDDPVIQRLLAQSMAEGEARGEARGEAQGKAQGKAQGIIEGKLETLKEAVLNIVSIRFSPALAAQAQSADMSIQDHEVLKRLHRQLLKAADEQSARLVLDLPDEQDEHLPSASLNE